MAVNGKQKGASFERKVCQQLSLWISQGKRKDLFWRSAMSGGRATLGKRRGEDLAHQAGDITAVHPEGHQLTDRYYIECKHYKSLDLESFWEGRGKLAKFWKTAVTEARKHGRLPMLIAKQNLTPVMVFVGTNSPLGQTRFVSWRSEDKPRGEDLALIWLSTMLNREFPARP